MKINVLGEARFPSPLRRIVSDDLRVPEQIVRDPKSPAPPELLQPQNGWQSDLYQYPQQVNFDWQALPGALFYQIEVYRDSLLRAQFLVYSNPRATQTSGSAALSIYGWYFWRVRAASKNWNNYTDWSQPFRFGLPNPAR